MSVAVFTPRLTRTEQYDLSFDAFVARCRSGPLPLITWLSMSNRSLTDRTKVIQDRLPGPVEYLDEGPNRCAILLHPDPRLMAAWIWSRDGLLVQDVTFQIRWGDGGTQKEVLTWLADYMASLDF